METAKHAVAGSIGDVVRTLELSGVPKESTIVLGGAALTLLEIRTTDEIEIMIGSDDFSTFLCNGALPDGSPLVPRDEHRQKVLEAILPYDETLPLTLRQPPPAARNKEIYESEIKRLPHLAGWAHMDALQLQVECTSKSGLLTAKARRARADRKLLEERNGFCVGRPMKIGL